MTSSVSIKRTAAAVLALGLAFAAFLAASTVSGGAAQAAPSQAQQPSPEGSTLLFLSTSGNQDFAGRQPFTGVAFLMCDPPVGLHPRPGDACRDLAAAGGDFANLPGIDVGCADYYQPVAVTAFGWWKGRLVSFNRTHSNMCYLYSAAGLVFPLPGGYYDRPGVVTSTSNTVPN